MLRLEMKNYDGITRPVILGTPETFYLTVANTWQLKVTEWAYPNEALDGVNRGFEAKIWNFTNREIFIGEDFKTLREAIIACLKVIVKKIGNDFVTANDSKNLVETLIEYDLLSVWRSTRPLYNGGDRYIQRRLNNEYHSYWVIWDKMLDYSPSCHFEKKSRQKMKSINNTHRLRVLLLNGIAEGGRIKVKMFTVKKELELVKKDGKFYRLSGEVFENDLTDIYCFTKIEVL